MILSKNDSVIKERRNPSADANAPRMIHAKLPNVAVVSGRRANEVRKKGSK